MKCTRTQLKKTLDLLRALDDGSPYFGLQWTDHGLAVFRSSNLGLVRAATYQETARPVIASLAHLATSLDAVRADEFDVTKGASDTLYVISSGEHGAQMRIHTVRSETPWRKQHNPGSVAKEFDPRLFAGIDPHPFSLRMEPVIKSGKMMLVTDAGVIMRHGIAAATVFPYPRSTFLRAIAGREISRLYLTSEGYWGAVTDSFEILVAGHRVGDPLFDKYNLPLAAVAELPASGLIVALQAALRWGDRNARVEFDTRKGVIRTEDSLHNPGEFAFGPSSAWASFAIDYPMLKLLVDAFMQSGEDKIQLVHNEGDVVRIARGPWEVSLRVYR